jgi:hypothetical protein
VNSGLYDVKEGEKGVLLVSPSQEAGHYIWANEHTPFCYNSPQSQESMGYEMTTHNFIKPNFIKLFVTKIVERSLIVRDVNWVP